MKIYYFNDTAKKQIVYTNDLAGKPTILDPASGQIFECSGDGSYSIPWIKVWETGVVLIADISKEMLNI